MHTLKVTSEKYGDGRRPVESALKLDFVHTVIKDGQSYTLTMYSPSLIRWTDLKTGTLTLNGYSKVHYSLFVKPAIKSKAKKKIVKDVPRRS